MRTRGTAVQCCEQGSILQRSHSHTLGSFHEARLPRRDLPNKPEESHTFYTQSGGAYSIEASRTTSWAKSQVSATICRWRSGVGLKPGGCSGGTCPVEWKSSRALRVTCGTATLTSGVARALNSYSPPAVEAPPKGIPITPHCLSLDIALGATVMADTDSILDCPRCTKSSLCSCSVHPVSTQPFPRAVHSHRYSLSLCPGGNSHR